MFLFLLIFGLVLLATHLFLTALRQALLGERDRKASIKREADHQRYQQFRQQREASRALIEQRVADEGEAFELMLVSKQQAREDRRRLLSPGWDLIGLLRQQGRISTQEYWAYCLDNTGEYCPSLLSE